MSMLTDILHEVSTRGQSERLWVLLVNGYFRGDDWEAQISAWAKANDLTVSFSDEHRSCLFVKKT
jgi:hypothetical protein